MAGGDNVHSELGFPVVGIGASAGGMEAFQGILQTLPPDTGMAFVYIQHLDPDHKSLLVNIFSKATRMPVVEAAEGVAVEPNHVYIVRPNQTLTISCGRLSEAPRTQRPGEYLPIDAFLRSLAQDQRQNAVAVILSGTSSDGTLGLIEVKHVGGITFAQDSTAKYGSMPGDAIKSGAVDFILPAEAIARELTRIARRRQEEEPSSDSEPTASANAHGFFRDPELFEELRKTIIPGLLKNRLPDEPVRIWVPGCGTGEEAYSLAICFLEALNETGAQADVRIFASDINDRSIAAARTGLFPDTLPDEIGPERARIFFTHTRGMYQVGKAVRELCVFAQHDVTKDPPFSSLDLLSARDLPEDVVEIVTPVFHYALKPSGYLLPGTMGPWARFDDLFKAVDRRRRIYLKNPARLPFDFGRVGARAATDVTASTRDAERDADRLAFRHYGHAGALVTEVGEIIQFKGNTAPFLRAVGGGSGHRLGDVAREELRAPLARALQRAADTRKAQRSKMIEIRQDGDEARHVSFEVLPVEVSGRRRYFLVLFEMFSLAPEPGGKRVSEAREADRRKIAHLENQLAASTENLHSFIDELKASQEELLSRNEELKSIGDQLEIRGKELETLNAELTSTNEQLHTRNEQLAHALADLSNLTEAVRMPIVLLDSGKRVRMFTPAARSVLNITPTDIGRLFTEIRGNFDIDSAVVLIDEAIRAKAAREAEITDRHGNWYLMRTLPYRTAEGETVGAVLVLFDIGKRKRVEQERERLQQRLAEAERLETIGRLAGGVAHDFNNLMTVVLGAAEFVRDHAHLSRHFRSEVDSILRAANRASALTSQLLAFGRRQMIQPRAIDLNPVVAAMSSLLLRLLGEHIVLRTKLCEQSCVVQADAGQIEQMVMNLVTNARDAIDGDGAITVATAVVKLDNDPEIGSGEFVRLSVSDTGAGMDEETKRHAFEPFFTTKGLGRGTGLGLSSVYGAVKQNGGEMRLESEPGRGSRFEIYLPLVHAEPEPPRTQVLPEVKRGSETILVVEDEARVRALARRYLERFGYKVIEAEDGVEALRVHENYDGAISLLLTDIVMPKMDGPELARRLLEHQPGLRVLFTSGYPLETIREFDLGAEPHFLPKPFDGQALGNKVREILDES